MRQARRGELTDNALVAHVWLVTLKALEGAISDKDAVGQIFEVIDRNRKPDTRLA